MNESIENKGFKGCFGVDKKLILRIRMSWVRILPRVFYKKGKH